ncbi:hypothetical protein HUE56_29605 (plasmid) [Azospirillum oryzae]|uniref:Uncharacterized protein n=1 Tax=Azospirillum oryzae TaxID=286727 RepID=A0A6N1ATH2_9PROT|nr:MULTISPECIES: hypothetical protein [Azospirillum]KAA0584767.1 hypothetical protein FZ938_28655 [Azospirillum oryzae]QCG99203.1 hypothetical protein E6C67_36055 [Azospirillum sp. TSA2s]QKS54659.1 hypothetical protein HUE56_29605 [Azospirillum oryzae]GLR77548.1 hypothetical protein GCM10007856_02160 [Azospirillum oryzae]
MLSKIRKPEAVKGRALGWKATTQVFTFEDITAMATAALRSAGVTAIRSLPDEHLARYSPPFRNRDMGPDRLA